MNICLECGKVFEDNEIAYWEERHGLDTPPYEKMSGCPRCYGAYDEAEECLECGKYFPKYELDENHLCENCLEDEE